MPVKKTILYPFSINSPYFEGYAWAFELAFRMKAKLQLFTSTAVSPGVIVPPDSIYRSILEAHGYYLEHYKHPESQLRDVSREPSITHGELKDDLLFHLKSYPVDIVIIDTPFLSTQFKGLQAIERQAKGMILLPDASGVISTLSHNDHFYDVLRRSELYKLPENFFVTLGNDKSIFNYLRGLFQKK
ncbi:hypothetical protein BH09BAC3_BH09BAC3_15580 [soil metagenome]